MLESNEELSSAILHWVATFKGLNHNWKTIDDLCDGVILTEIMNQVAPEVFELSKITTDVNGEWVLSMNNLNYLFGRLEHYYKEYLGKPFDKKYVDTLLIAQKKDMPQFYNLIEVVLGAIVQCDNKEEYIKAILTLDEIHQTALMHLIEKILEKCAGNNPNDLSTSLSEIRQSPGYHGQSYFPRPDVNEKEKQLLAKLEEIEDENNHLTKKLTELLNEKEALQAQVKDFSLEMARKNEEIKNLILDKEKMMEKINSHEVQDELNQELKMKDYKIKELNNFIDELKQKHETEVNRLRDELSEQKLKIISMSKMEATLEMYKQRCEDYTKVSNRVVDLEQELDSAKAQIEELTRTNEQITKKMNHFKEKIEEEKTKNINLEIELTRKNTEIESLQNEKRRMETLNQSLEEKLHELNKLIETIQKEQADTTRNHTSTERAMSQLANDFQEMMLNLEKENKQLKTERKEANVHVTEDNGEKELLENEIRILRNKCIEIEATNQILKEELEKSQDIKTIEKLKRENQTWKDEAERWKRMAEKSAVKGDLEVENGTLRAEIMALKKELLETNSQLERKKRLYEEVLEKSKGLQEELHDKVRIIEELTQKMTSGDVPSLKTRKLEEQLFHKDNQIQELTKEVEVLKAMLNSVDENREEEFRIVTVALTDLAVRNLELDMKINGNNGGDGLGRLAPLDILKKNRK